MALMPCDRSDRAPPEGAWGGRVSVHLAGEVGEVSGGITGRPHLGHLPPQVMQLALQRAFLTESSAQCGLLGVEQSLQVLEPGLGSHQVSLLLGIAKEAREEWV